MGRSLATVPRSRLSVYLFSPQAFSRLLPMASVQVADWWKAPDEVFAVDGHCGLLAAWIVLAARGRLASVPEIARKCRHTKRHGIFTVSLAAALTEMGLVVSFHSDPDPEIGEFERRCYARAYRIGVLVRPALTSEQLLDEVQRDHVSIVLFNTDSDQGHFSPLLGEIDGKLHLPLANQGSMSRDEFRMRWSAPGILRQCVVIE